MEPIGPLQLRVMQRIWAQGPSTVNDVHAALMSELQAKRLAYTTILTVMRNLARRGFLSQVREGRAHRFVAQIDERTFQVSLLSQVCTDVFRGDLQALINTAAAANTPLREDRARSCATIAPVRNTSERTVATFAMSS
ncbi:MAG: BlaI/MecI/CopY family transcriptional regulator [Planctomycetota bacterium]